MLTQTAGDVAIGAAAEYAQTGEITIEGVTFQAIFSGAGNLIALKQIKNAGTAPKADNPALLPAGQKDSPQLLPGRVDETGSSSSRSRTSSTDGAGSTVNENRTLLTDETGLSSSRGRTSSTDGAGSTANENRTLLTDETGSSSSRSRSSSTDGAGSTVNENRTLLTDETGSSSSRSRSSSTDGAGSSSGSRSRASSTDGAGSSSSRSRSSSTDGAGSSSGKQISCLIDRRRRFIIKQKPYFINGRQYNIISKN